MALTWKIIWKKWSHSKHFWSRSEKRALLTAETMIYWEQALNAWKKYTYFGMSLGILGFIKTSNDSGFPNL